MSVRNAFTAAQRDVCCSQPFFVIFGRFHEVSFLPRCDCSCGKRPDRLTTSDSIRADRRDQRELISQPEAVRPHSRGACNEPRRVIMDESFPDPLKPNTRICSSAHLRTPPTLAITHIDNRIYLSLLFKSVFQHFDNPLSVLDNR